MSIRMTTINGWQWLREKCTKGTFAFDEFAEFSADSLCLHSVFSLSSVLVFMSLSLCLSDDDEDTKLELHKTGRMQLR